MNSKENIKKLKVAKIKCLTSLSFFTRYFFKHQHGRKFIEAEHHKKIIHALTRVVKGDCRRLIINLPPRFGKTELAVKMFIGWCMALNPESKFIHLSYSDSLALDNSEEVKDLITSEEYQQLFHEVQIKKDSKAKNKWYTTAGGGVLARSSSGQVTGFGAGAVDDPDAEIQDMLSELEKLQKFAGAIIIDDPIKPEDAESEVLRDKVNRKFETTIRSRTNSRNTPIIIIMQRVHEEDLAGYLMNIEPDEWEVLCLPAIKEDGTPLWEHKMNLDDLEKVKRANNYVFETQYMQNPSTPEGKPFHKSKLKWFSKSELEYIRANSEGVISYIDAKDEGKDFYAHPFAHVIGGNFYVTDAIHNQHNTDITVPMSINLIKSTSCQHTVVETNNMGGMVLKQIRSAVESRVVGIPNTSNKHTRIAMQEANIQNKFRFMSDPEPGSEYESFLKYLTKFEYGEPNIDDAPDAMGGLSNLAQVKFPHLFK